MVNKVLSLSIAANGKPWEQARSPQREEYEGMVRKCHRTLGAAPVSEVFLGEQRKAREPCGQISKGNKEPTDEVTEDEDKSDFGLSLLYDALVQCQADVETWKYQ